MSGGMSVEMRSQEVSIKELHSKRIRTYLLSKVEFTSITGNTPKVRMNSLDLPSGVGKVSMVSDAITIA